MLEGESRFRLLRELDVTTPFRQVEAELIPDATDEALSSVERAAFEQEMTAGKVDWQLHVYGGVVHSFTNPDADRGGRLEVSRYDAKADARSWAAMRQLFAETLDG